MCDVDLIAGLVTAASVGVLAAIVLFTIAAAMAGSFWGAFGNSVLMALAVVALVAAQVSLDIAISRLGSCGPVCAGPEAVVRAALMGAAAGLAALLVAAVVGIVAASIPWAGVIVALALVVGGVACIVSFGVLAVYLGQLSICVRGAATPAVVAGQVAAVIAAFAIGILLAMVSGVGPIPRGEPPKPPEPV